MEFQLASQSAKTTTTPVSPQNTRKYESNPNRLGNDFIHEDLFIHNSILIKDSMDQIKLIIR